MEEKAISVSACQKAGRENLFAGMPEKEKVGSGNMFLGKTRRVYWKDVIEKELEKLESGDITALRTVYCAFALGDPKLMGRVAGVIRRELEPYSLNQMIALYERFRTFTSLEWSIDWAAVPLEKIIGNLEEKDRRYVLIVGTFHPNGYFRERCMEALFGERQALPYLLLRANDWAGPVRERAFSLIEKYLETCKTGEILYSLPVVEKLKRSGRRSDAQMEKLGKEIFARLEQTLKGADWSELWPEDFSVRKSLYRISMDMGLLTLEQMNRWLSREKDFCGRMILVRGILSHPDCTLAEAEACLSYPNCQVRKKALEYKYEHLKSGWPGLERFLLDSGHGVRDYAAYILERHTEFDIRGYYLEHLKDEKPEYAILGLSEYSRRGNVPLLLRGLKNPVERVQRCTLTALGRQEDFDDEELLWRFLLNKKPGISKAAYLAIRKREFRLGAERLYHAYCQAEEEHLHRYLLHLLLNENSWSRMPWLIRLYRKDLPCQERQWIYGGLCCRSLYTKVPDAQKEEILRALKERGEELPEGMKKDILFDLKHV